MGLEFADVLVRPHHRAQLGARYAWKGWRGVSGSGEPRASGQGRAGV